MIESRNALLNRNLLTVLTVDILLPKEYRMKSGAISVLIMLLEIIEKSIHQED